MQAFHHSKQHVSAAELRRAKPYTPLSNDPGKRRRHNWEGPHPKGHMYRAGDVVKQSGIYEAIHEGEHRPAHDVVMIASDLFPPCDTCSERVRFRLVRTAPYIFTDEDFEKQD
jgi:hypothetical protein